MTGIVLALIAATTCAVTTPNDVVARGGEPVGPGGSHGNELLSAGPFGIPSGGTFVFRPGGPGFVTRGGSLGHKFGWQLGVGGRFTIDGRRLDAPAAPLSALNDGVVAPGFHATALIFPTPGCWEVTGRVGDASLTFVVSVEKIGDGPAWHRDELP